MDAELVKWLVGTTIAAVTLWVSYLQYTQSKHSSAKTQDKQEYTSSSNSEVKSQTTSEESVTKVYSYRSNKSGTTYYLHSKETEARGGKRTIFFFSREIKEAKDGTRVLTKVPEGYTVTESAQTGLPFLLKK